ncbi:MAG: class I SAM-dependent methyltransferase [Acidobacteriaceae bacterium]|jgi:SAM-dependent methyltransferase
MPQALNPYSQAMLDYWHGDSEATYSIRRDDGFSQEIRVAPSFDTSHFNPLEQLAMSCSTGRILDTGAGVGRHTLFLQQSGRNVTALELEPELAAIMLERGVEKSFANNIFTLEGVQFDTILMLMNGFGLVGTLAGADAFFEHARHLVSPEGQILCDSLDVRRTTNPTHLALQQSNLRMGKPIGQMNFCIKYQGKCGEPFDWLHLDFGGLSDLARNHGWTAELLAQEENGHYLAKLVMGSV